ncbi:energy transducer TonB [Solimonas sp. K1W22B-7]|uniref:energy transducer TonB n=1 Tax=Solimonas sp. K1W22B-7 TaxID=2303331 RepID=UPI000E33033F|nr:energy transducer TonB [Solimonas sp. K1W22B-7]AXQ28480.1 energy transducer TonB [Solimonas sp. K1W22B-7]
MSYAQPQRDPGQFLVGLSAVVVFHAALVYALASGLAGKVVEVIKGPLQVALIEEVKPPPPPPPPPPKVVKQLPRPVVPPPSYVPPVETPVQPPPAPVIQATAPEPPPPAPAAPPAPAVPQQLSIGVACPDFRNHPPQIPPQAERQGLSGDVVVEFTVDASGSVKNVQVTRSTNSIFNSAAVRAVSQYRCTAQGREVRVRQPISFRVD